ncbi:coiled-coil domain-containing protein [Geobacter pickeringii]|uniref:TolA protein n=1 Tax=Geobacter pickeringii TaxID=345632 RepID=A0A0B5BG58_9BACT|nr:hypothetical protein [Geobacter pickeringii]AJE04119.1 hypothetical protein GPICK_12805 [Geobacter pickeringii]
MFVLDTSLGSIEADEADVIEIHRSDAPLPAAPGKLAPRPCNAYVCVVRQNDVVRVYAVLEQVDRKKSFIYRPEPPPPARSPVDRLVKEASAFLAELGFTLREVSLKYGKAMREVVIRDIRVIRKPSSAPAMDEAVVGAEGEKPEEKPPPSAKASAAPVEEPAARVAALSAEAERLGTEKEDAEKRWAERQAGLAAEIERLGRERDEARRAAEVEGAALAAESKRLEAEVTRLTAEKQKAEQKAATRGEELRKEVERLTAERAAAEGAEAPDVARLRQEVARLKEELRSAVEAAVQSRERLAGEADRLRGELQQLETDVRADEEGGAQRIDAISAEIGRLTTSRQDNAKAAAARIAGLEAEATRLAAATAADESRLAADVAALQEIVSQRTAEREAARAAGVERLARLVAEAELATAERAAVERVISAKGGASAELLAQATADVSALKEEVERLAVTKGLAEQTAAARIAALQAEVEHLAAQKEGGAAAKQGEPRKPEQAPPPLPPAERRRSSTAEVVASTPVPSGTGKGAEAFETGWDEEVGTAVDALLNGGGEAEADPFAFMGGGSGFTSFGAPGPVEGDEAPASFHLDKSLDCIEYGVADEVVELHQTLNMVTISPEGHKPQSCGAYICALKRGAGFRVFVAWTLETDRKTLVYSPDTQPATADACAKAVRDAFAFVETVGFMMDAVSLPADPEKRARALAKVPALCRRG